jgi:hypothetical protein
MLGISGPQNARFQALNSSNVKNRANFHKEQCTRTEEHDNGGKILTTVRKMRRDAVVEDGLGLALLLRDAGKQPQRRTVGNGGSGETLAG